MFCSKCGAENKLDARFCHKCGNALAFEANQLNASPPSPALHPIWNPNATANWSLLFTPAFGSYLQMLNWKALGEPAKADFSKTWFKVSLVMLAVYLFIVSIVPDEKAADAITRGLGILFLITWYFASSRSQAKYVKVTLGAHYSRQPWGKALMYGIGGMVAYFVVATLIGAIADVAK